MMNSKDVNQQLFDFIEASPSAFHAVYEMKKRLLDAGYEQLLESRFSELSIHPMYTFSYISTRFLYNHTYLLRPYIPYTTA